MALCPITTSAFILPDIGKVKPAICVISRQRKTSPMTLIKIRMPRLSHGMSELKSSGGALGKFSYKTNMGNKVEYTEQGAWDDHELTIKGYKESQGWGGGSYVKISNQLGDKMANEIGKKFKVSKWNVDNEGSLHLQGDFGENGFIG